MRVVTSGRTAAAERVASWVKTLGQGTGADTTLRFAPSTSNSIDITHANPSGLAQFLAGRRTRLSTLLHDADQFAVAKRTARALDAKIDELWDERGIDVGYLAAGVANWRATHEGRSEALSAPIMLGRIKLTRHLDQDDYDVQLVGRAIVSPAFIRQVEADHHAAIDTQAVHAAAYSIARFDPVRGMDALRHQLAERRQVDADLEALEVEHQHVGRLLRQHGKGLLGAIGHAQGVEQSGARLLERAAALPGRIDEQAAARLPCAFLLRHPFSFYFLASQFAKNAGKFAIKPWEGIVKNCSASVWERTVRHGATHRYSTGRLNVHGSTQWHTRMTWQRSRRRSRAARTSRTAACRRRRTTRRCRPGSSSRPRRCPSSTSPSRASRPRWR
ncbi:DUF4011 domain-containing protein [Massilia sp. UBA6681]|uniref:DUF4011 domain-containing protein n=1 Tax=Massilia sp. UBA6681 TaxID=1946839 RepID=UPI0039C993F8